MTPTATPLDGIAPAAARQSFLREHNLAVLTQAIFASPEPLSRAALAGQTGMTRSTVSRLIEELLDGQIITEHAARGVGRPGRPAHPLTPAAGSIAGLGMQVNVDYMAGRVVDLTGRTLAEETIEGDFEDSDPAVVLPRAGDMARGLLDQATSAGAAVAQVQLGLPGLVDQSGEWLLLAPNLGWQDVRPADHLGAGLLPPGVGLEVSNDANLAAYAEAMAAPGRRAESSTFLYLGGDIGIGSAIVARGRVVTGESGWAGEVGHVAIEPDGPQCHCGARGCLERYAGKHAVLEAAQLPLETTSAELAAAAGRGYGPAHLAVERAAWALGIALADMVNIVDIKQIVLGAGFIPLVDQLRPGIEEQLRLRVLSGPLARPTIRAAVESRAPAAAGGALRALDAVIRHPAAWLAG